MKCLTHPDKEQKCKCSNMCSLCWAISGISCKCSLVKNKVENKVEVDSINEVHNLQEVNEFLMESINSLTSLGNVQAAYEMQQSIESLKQEVKKLRSDNISMVDQQEGILSLHTKTIDLVEKKIATSNAIAEIASKVPKKVVKKKTLKKKKQKTSWKG